MTHRTLFQILVELMVLNIVFFNRIVNEWNGLPNRIRESNSIATFEKNVLSFINLRDALFLLFNARDSCVGPPLPPSSMM